MILIIGAWIYYFLLTLFIGAGLLELISKITRNAINVRFGLFYQFWFGFAVVIGLLQLFSFLLPISFTAFTILSVLAALSAVLCYRTFLTGFMSVYKRLLTPKGIFYFLGVCLILLIISYAANKEVLHADTYLYHFNGVKWAREYPAVPGLANLHSRLGFNSSFFLFAALTETGFKSGESAHIALSFMFAICLIHWFFVIVNRRELIARRFFCTVTAVFLVIHIMSQIDITSLSTDYPMSILLLVFCLILLDKIDHKILLLLPIAAVIFSFKLSGILTIAFGLAILTGYILQLKFSNTERLARKPQIRSFTVSLILLGFIALGFVARNAIVSGWLLFPFPVGNLHLPWSVPTPYAADAMAWVESWAKVPGGASPADLKSNGFFWWFTKWYAYFLQLFESHLLGFSIFFLSWSVILISSFGKFLYARLNLLAIALFALMNILFWFVSAPDIRFGSVYFYIFFAASVVLFYEASRQKNIIKVFVALFCVYQIIDRLPNYSIDRGPQLFTFAYTKPRELVRVIASPAGEKPEFYIYMPAQGDACGNSPLPCTPYAGGLTHQHRPIRLRVPNNLAKGFLPVE